MATEMDPATVTAIINNINSLYGNLVSYTVGLILFVGAFVPAVISFFQNRQFKREYEELSKRMQIEIQDRMADVERNMASIMEASKHSLLAQLQTENKVLEALLKKEIGVMKGAAAHLQAQQHEHNPASCLDSCVSALKRYLESNDEMNARSIINLSKSAINNLDESSFDGADMVPEAMNPSKSVQSIIDTLKKHGHNGRYQHDIDELMLLLRNAKACKNGIKTAASIHQEEATQ